MFFNLSSGPSVVHEYLFELRQPELQRDRFRFRKNMERVGELIAYEISRKFVYKESEVVTSLGVCPIQRMETQPVLVTILRAGIPFMNGFLNVMDKADVGLMGAWREEGTEEVTIRLEYVATPDLHRKTLILIDPMLATGKSMVKALEVLLKKGTPDFVHIASMIATPAGVDLVTSFMKEQGIGFGIWTAALDEKLNAQFYIVPGLGDAGDLSYGAK